MSESTTNDDIFKPISGDQSAKEVTEIESLCVNCGESGVTRLLLTMIPFYREVVIVSFACPHCNFENNEIQSAGEIQRQGVQCTLDAKSPEDLNRQVIKSDYASLEIPQLELEVPRDTQKGEITTVEGILQRVIRALEQDQDRRKEEHPEDYERIQAFMDRVQKCLRMETPFTLMLGDISGNSFISPPPGVLPGQKDERLQLIRTDRTTEENHLLGIYPELANSDATAGNQEEIKEPSAQAHVPTAPAPAACDKGEGVKASSAERQESEEEEKTEKSEEKEGENFHDEVLEFPTNCPDCGAGCQTKMKLTRIPYFKEVVVMATDCEKCGSRTNEVKSGGGIEAKGRRITLRVTNLDDLCRDVLKSETCDIEVPDLELEVGAGTLGGKFTTLEGLLCNVKDQLSADNPLISGDSAETGMKAKMEQLCQKFDRLLSCEVPFTVILDDPAGNSYLQNVYAPDDDPEMKVEDYERNFEQKELLGLNDMKVENYSDQ